MKKNKNQELVTTGEVPKAIMIDHAPEHEKVSLVQALNFVNQNSTKEATMIMLDDMEENGYVSEFFMANENPCPIKSKGEKKVAAFIPAMEFDYKHFDIEGDDTPLAVGATTVMVNTINDGFHNVTLSEEGQIMDLGPVVAPAIIGNAERAYGMYVPFNNTNAMMAAADLLVDTVNDYSKALDEAKPTAPDECGIAHIEDVHCSPYCNLIKAIELNFDLHGCREAIKAAGGSEEDAEPDCLNDTKW